MLERVRYYFKLLGLPLFLIFLFASLNLLWKVSNLPPADELAGLLQGWFDLYGLPIVFLSSIVEGGLLVGNYFPGVFVIFIGVILSDTISQAITVVAVVSAGLMVAHNTNYFLGRYGWYQLLIKFGMKGAVVDAQEKLAKRGPMAILLSYWMPSLGALTDTAAGIIRLPYKVFISYSIVSTILWNTLVGTIVYIIGDKALVVAAPSGTRSIVFYVIVVIWIGLLLFIDKYGEKESEVLSPVDEGESR